MNLFIYLLIYLYASIPFSLLIGLLFFNVDIRKIGSGNVGASNLGRALGAKGFIMGFICDLSKGIIAVLLAQTFGMPVIICGILAILGHTYSIFLKFKGGKGIATAFGFVLAYTFWGALFAITIFIITLKITKYISLSSIIAVFSYVIYSLLFQSTGYFFLSIVIWLLIVYFHRENIKRLKNNTEKKITWM